jgi:hypothetical protein
MRLLVLFLTWFLSTSVMAASLDESPQTLRDRIIAVMKQLGKVNVIEDDSKCDTDPDGSTDCSVFSAGNNFVMIYGSPSSRILGIRVIPATEDMHDYFYLLVATIFAVNTDNQDFRPFIDLAGTLVQNIKDENKYRESKDDIIYRVAPWYVKELKQSFLVVEIEKE